MSQPARGFGRRRGVTASTAPEFLDGQGSSGGEAAQERIKPAVERLSARYVQFPSYTESGPNTHIILFKQLRADEADDDFIVGDDADNLGAALDFAVEMFNRISSVQLCAMLFPEGHVGSTSS